MKIKGSSLFGKLGIGLAGIFLLFVFGGCEKEKSVTGHTASTATETFINDTAMAQSIDSTSKTFSMDQYKKYTGTMYVSVDPGYWGCKDWRERNGYATARIIWGPWETEEVNLHSIKKTAIRFQKTKPDSIPLTVIVNGCDQPTINLYKGEPKSWEYWKVYIPKWKSR